VASWHEEVDKGVKGLSRGIRRAVVVTNDPERMWQGACQCGTSVPRGFSCNTVLAII